MRIANTTSQRAAMTLALLSIMAATVPVPSRAEPTWGPRAFCTVGGEESGPALPNCYYYTLEQCLASARGNGQSCTTNPYSAGATTNGVGAAPRHRTHAKR
jgi:hypothetical protein